MISAISWVLKGASKPVPDVAEEPSKEEIEELIKIGALESSEDVDDSMNVEDEMQNDQLAYAEAVAEAIGKTSKNKSGIQLEEVTGGLKELDIDEEDNGIEPFSSGIGDLYYLSNEMDPYLNHNDDDDSEGLEDTAIKPMDAVIFCA